MSLPSRVGAATEDDVRQQNAALTQENARLMEAIAVRDAFLAVVAHELRNPMTPILGRVTMLRRAMEIGNVAPEKIAKGLDQIEWLMTLLIKRTTTLLDVSRMTSNKLRVDRVPVDVQEVATVVAANFRPLAEHAGSTLDLDLPSETLTIAGDRLALEQVLDNLVSNAIKYGAGQPIVVGAVAFPDLGTAQISVKDGGPGISAKNQARIFERFERAVEPGTAISGFGVGLWIVQQLCQAMEGAVEIVSSAGVGSKFTVTLPLHKTRETE